VNLPLESLVRDHLRAVPDYPKPGILFQDITPVLANADLLRAVTERMAGYYSGGRVTKVVGIEARGFILGSPVALALKTGFIPVRKPGKLPWKSIRREYALEYGTNVVEAHSDAIVNGDRVLIVDDVLATGGTAAAAADLVRELGGEVVGWTFLLELGFLNGRSKLTGARIESVVVI
jgi:adenine phosphoribosyltransferase